MVRFEKLERSDALVIYEKDNMTSIKSYENQSSAMRPYGQHAERAPKGSLRERRPVPGF